jgi:drug/metabolite transporter (DMT)-like permease
MKSGVIYALAAAALFGASTPFAKLLVGQIPPIILAGMLYLGSGIGLLSWLLLRRRFSVSKCGKSESFLTRADLPWLAGAIVVGGIVAPLLLMYGLSNTPASTSSLLLNMEGVFTTLLAWSVFRENYDTRIFLGMVLIVAAGALLSWEQVPKVGIPWGTFAILGACLCWAIDNNFTRQVSASDSVQIAGLKGLVAGLVNLSLGLALGFHLPVWSKIMSAGLVGLCGYGISLVLFVLALRNLGTARTGAYFSSAPFFGAAISILVLHEATGRRFWVAAVFRSSGLEWSGTCDFNQSIARAGSLGTRCGSRGRKAAPASCAHDGASCESWFCAHGDFHFHRCGNTAPASDCCHWRTVQFDHANPVPAADFLRMDGEDRR